MQVQMTGQFTNFQFWRKQQCIGRAQSDFVYCLLLFALIVFPLLLLLQPSLYFVFKVCKNGLLKGLIDQLIYKSYAMVFKFVSMNHTLQRENTEGPSSTTSGFPDTVSTGSTLEWIYSDPRQKRKLYQRTGTQSSKDKSILNAFFAQVDIQASRRFRVCTGVRMS